MATPETSGNANAELVRRHKSTSTTVLSLLVAVVLLCVLAYVSQKFLVQRSTVSLDIPVRITILIFGLGAIALRRTKFARMRLQDIGALQGAHGLIVTLHRTTLLIALIGIGVALIGFATTLLTGSSVYTYQAGVVAAAVLLYGYPVRRSWEQVVRQFASANDQPNGFLD